MKSHAKKHYRITIASEDYYTPEDIDAMDMQLACWVMKHWPNHTGDVYVCASLSGIVYAIEVDKQN